MRRLGKIALGAAIFVGWLCFVLLLQSLGTVTQAEVPVTTYDDWYDVVNATAPSASITVPLSPAERDISALLRKHPLWMDFEAAIEASLYASSPLKTTVDALLRGWNATLRIENLRPTVTLLSLHKRVSADTKIYCGDVLYDIVLTVGDRELRIPDLTSEVLFHHRTGSASSAIIDLCGDVFATASGLLGVVRGDDTQLYDSTLTPVAEDTIFPELRRAHKILALMMSDRLGIIAVVRMDDEDYLYLPGTDDAQPYLFALANPAEQRRNPRFENAELVTDMKYVVKTPAAIEEFGGRFILIHSLTESWYWGYSVVCDLQTDGVHLLFDILEIPLEGNLSWPWANLVTLYECAAAYRGELCELYFVTARENGVLVSCDYTQPPARKNDIVHFARSHVNFEEFAKVNVSRESGALRMVSIGDSLRHVVVDFHEKTVSLDYRPGDPAAVSPNGRYRLHSVYMGSTYSCESSTTEWYVEDMHENTFIYVGATADSYGSWFGFVDDDTLYCSYDWRSGVALYSTSTGERLDWALFTAKKYEDNEPSYYHLFQALYDPSINSFISLEQGETLAESELTKAGLRSEDDTYMPLLIALYDRSGNRYAEYDTGLIIGAEREWNSNTPINIRRQGMILFFDLSHHIAGEWIQAGYAFDLATMTLVSADMLAE